MHPLMLREVIKSCRERIAQGDCPTTPPFTVEQLEEAIATLAPVAGEDAKLIERIHALSDCAYWATCGWDIPGDGIQKIGRLALKAADRIAAQALEIAELRERVVPPMGRPNMARIINEWRAKWPNADVIPIEELAKHITPGDILELMTPLDAAQAREIAELRADYARESEALTQAIEQVAAERARAEAAEAECARLRQDAELTFVRFREANVRRCLKWHPAGIESWSPSDWLTAVTGELGELASLLKMRNRERDGLPGNKFSPSDKQVADEIADVFTYLDLLAAALGVDLGAAVVEKFNEVSERVGFLDRIDKGK